MISLLNPILAQAAVAPEEITAGVIITAIMFMMTAAGSMAMIVVWIIRYSQTGNALPAAERGVLRVPWPLMFVVVYLSVLFMLLMLLGSVAEMNNISSNVAGSTTAEAEGTSSISPEKMKDALVQTIVMDLLMLLIFGAVVLLASQAGRVDLKPSPHEFTSPQRELPLDEHNPFAVLLTEEEQPVDESFSFLRELRFAAEVFLAVYLPTAALKLIIVLISMTIVGEPPKSHPFLEMIDAGVSISMIATILIMAVFVAPIVEELQFRVIVLGGIAQLGWPKLALFGSSILFAFAHGFPDSIALIPLAIGLGYTYLRRRSYVTVMLVHFLFNAFNMVLALVGLL